MCGIFGYISKQPVAYEHHSDSIQRLLELSSARGKEASGMLVLNEDLEVNYIKSGLLSRDLIKTEEYKAFCSHHNQKNVFLVMGHSRLATNGSQLADENNQPVISLDKSLALVHNGILTNTATLWEKTGSRDKEPELDTRVMAEFLSSQIKKEGINKAACRLMTEMEGSASFAMLIPGTKCLLLMTNTGSLYYVVDEHKEILYFASERIFLEEIIEEAYNKKEEIQKILPQTGIVYLNGTLQRIAVTDCEDITMSPEKEPLAEHFVSYKQFPSPKNNAKSLKLYSFDNKITDLKKHQIDFNKIGHQKRCTKCILPATTPFITFDQSGVCNFCLDYEKITYRGKDQLERIIEKYRSRDGSPDCIAAFSGGRDSSYGLHYLKKELGMNPIAYTYDWGMVTDLARRNQARMLGKLGIEHLLLSADITKKRLHIQQNISAWMKDPHLGMVPLFMQGDKQCEFYADQLMKKYDIKLMFFFRGNELERGEFKNGHCGIKDADPGGVIHHLPAKDKLKLLAFYGWRYIKNPSYFNASFWDTALAYFSTYIQKHDYIYLWHYIPWNEEIINKTLAEEYNWEVSSESRQKWRTDDGSSAFYNYIYCQVQGSTENDSFRSRQIREGILNREEALDIVLEENQPRYEALKWYFDRVGMNGSEVLSIVDRIPKLY